MGKSRRGGWLLVVLLLLAVGVTVGVVLTPSDGAVEPDDRSDGVEQVADPTSSTESDPPRRRHIREPGRGASVDASDADPDRLPAARPGVDPAVGSDSLVTSPGSDDAATSQALVVGRITSGVDGRPLAGVTLEVFDWHDAIDPPSLERGTERSVAAEVAGSDDGAFSVAALDGSDRPVVFVRAPGHATQTFRTDATVPGDAQTRDIVLPPAGGLAGRVLAPDGSPVDGALVLAVERDALDLEEHGDALAAAREIVAGSDRYDDDRAYRFAASYTDAEGRFAFDDLIRSAAYVVFGVATNWAESTLVDDLTATASPTPFDVRLRPYASLRIDVSAADGTPVDVQRIDLRAALLEPTLRREEPGRYVLAPVSPGHHVLDLETATHGEVRHEVDVPEGIALHQTLVSIASGNTASGVVRDSDGRPIGQARVNIQVLDRTVYELRSVSVETDANGRWSQAGLPDGPVTLYVSRDGFMTAKRVELPPPVIDVEIGLLRARNLTVDLVLPAGVSHPHRVLTAARSVDGAPGAEPEAWVRGRASWDAGEPVALDPLPLGRARLRIWVPGCALYDEAIAITPDSPEHLGTIELQPVETLTARLVDADGEPVAGALAHAQFGTKFPLNWQHIRRASGPDGLVVLELHRAGPISVYIEADDRQLARRSVGERSTLTEPVEIEVGALKR